MHLVDSRLSKSECHAPVCDDYRAPFPDAVVHKLHVVRLVRGGGLGPRGPPSWPLAPFDPKRGDASGDDADRGSMHNDVGCADFVDVAAKEVSVGCMICLVNSL